MGEIGTFVRAHPLSAHPPGVHSCALASTVLIVDQSHLSTRATGLYSFREPNHFSRLGLDRVSGSSYHGYGMNLHSSGSEAQVQLTGLHD
jgi:hypothetical protein